MTHLWSVSTPMNFMTPWAPNAFVCCERVSLVYAGETWFAFQAVILQLIISRNTGYSAERGVKLYKDLSWYEIPWIKWSVCVSCLLELYEVEISDLFLQHNPEVFSPCSVVCLVQLFPLFIFPSSLTFICENTKYILSVFLPHGCSFKMFLHLCPLFFTYTIFPCTVYGTWFLTYSCAIKDAVLTNWLL